MHRAEVSRCELVLVEDDEGDVLLMQEALKASGLKCKLTVFHRGEDGLAYLRAKRPASAPVQLVLLDVNLPGASGLEILGRLKNDQATRMIPVVVLSTTDSERDVRRAYESFANCFVTKPRDIDGLVRLIRNLTELWLGPARLPAAG